MPSLTETFAELSRERRRMRAEGLTERYAIWFQTGKVPSPKHFTVTKQRSVMERVPKPPPKPLTHIDRPAQPPPGPFSHYPRMSTEAKKHATKALSHVQGGRCYICQRRFGDGWACATFDHVTPFSQCGVNEGNGAAACALCNHEKGDRIPTQSELDALAEINRKLAEYTRVNRTRAKRSVSDAWSVKECT